MVLVGCPLVCREVWSAGPRTRRAKEVPMRALDLVADYPVVPLDTPVRESARLLAAQDVPGMIVRGDEGMTILPGTEALRLAVHRYIMDDPALARVVDEAHADKFLRALGGSTVRG